MKTDKTIIGDVTIWWRYNQPIAFKTPGTGTIAREDAPWPFPADTPVDEFNQMYDEAIANKLKETV